MMAALRREIEPGGGRTAIPYHTGESGSGRTPRPISSAARAGAGGETAPIAWGMARGAAASGPERRVARVESIAGHGARQALGDQIHQFPEDGMRRHDGPPPRPPKDPRRARHGPIVPQPPQEA